MKVKQIYEIMNTITESVTGKTELLKEDLSNIVDVGKAILTATEVDNYVKTLVDHIARVIFVDRVYTGNAPSILMDSWEYGAVVEKIRVETPEAKENASWTLTDGQDYSPNIFYKPKVTVKFFADKTTFEVPMSYTEMQVKGSFDNASQLNAFLSMIQNAVEKAMTVRLDALIMRTINNMTGLTIASEFADKQYSKRTGVRAINLLKLYNTATGSTLKAENAITNMDFLKFASYHIGLTASRLSTCSTLFNIGAKDTFTSRDRLHTVMLSEFKNASDVFLQSSTFNDNFTKLPTCDEVPFWQASGKNFDFANTSKINIKTTDETEVEVSGIIAVMFDREALGVTVLNKRVTTNYNAKAEFFNHWFKTDAGYFNDTDENFVVFFIA